MPIIYKLVGIKSENDVKNEMTHLNWDINEKEKKEINIKDIYSLFSSLGVTENISDIKFITNSETMKDDKNYSMIERVDADNKIQEYNIIIFVFTMNEEIKQKLKTIFDTHGYVTKKENVSIVELSKPIPEDDIRIKEIKQKLKTVFDTPEDTSKKENTANIRRPHVELSKPIPEDDIRIDEDAINKSNKETVNLFSNKQFQTLVKIYYENPDVFKTFASYISSGNTVDASHFTNITDVSFDDEFQEIKGLNLDIDDSIIQNTLKKFNGHINLTLRYILTTKSITSDI